VQGNEAEHGGRVIDVTVNLGVAEYRPAEEVDQLLSRADRALAAAKAGGRQRVVAA
jgi:PleD family two-component response regulator